MKRVAVGLLWTVLLGCVCGCKAKIFRAETELNSDGRVRRAIYQPTEETPEAAREFARWQGATYAGRIPHEDWRGSIDELPAAASDKDHDYFAAWGQFDDAGQLPQTLIVNAPDDLADGTLEREYERTDYVLVTEHRWRETLTDVVSLDDMHRARQELAAITLPIAEKFLTRAYGEDHDVQPLIDWLHQHARPMFEELTDAYFELAARKTTLDEARLLTTFEPILTRHGIQVRDANGVVLDSDAVFPTFARNLLVEKLRRRDGKPAAQETIAEFSQWLGIENRPDNNTPSRLDGVFNQAIAESFPNEEAFRAKMHPLVTRILGLYIMDFGPERHFQYQHKMPGTLVETSGELLSDNETVWRFTDGQAYPFGYTMACRSLEPNAALEQKLLKKPVLTDRKAMLRYVELVRENEPLLAVLRTCEADGDLQRLRREHELLKQAGDDGAAAFGQMLSLLEGQ